MKIEYRKDQLIFFFKGDLDNFTLMKVKENVIAMIKMTSAKTVIFDFEDVTFIDSTGIGFVLARYNQIQAYQGQLMIKNCSPSLNRLFLLSGLHQIIPFVNKEREGVL